jgi:predicted DCC family thiol-disulfide oxidoreductase YuxK
MNPNRSDARFWPDNGIILYDGICVLCSGWMRFVLRRDHQRLFRFTPIQSDYGRALALSLGINPEDPDTNALV